MCFPRRDLLNGISSEDVMEIIENHPEDEEYEDSDEEVDVHDCLECIQRTNHFLLERLNHVLQKCEEEEMEEGVWSEMKPENQMRVFLYVSKLKEEMEDKEEESDRQEKPGTDKLEEEFNNLVDHIITEQYLVIH